jgi:large subunit ribosomal protein L3
LQVKRRETDGYEALQLGFEERRPKGVTEPMLGHFKKAGVKPKKFIKEIRWDGQDDIKPGATFGVEIFENTKRVDVTGITKGRGFAGVVKRWGFAGGPATHGMSDRERAPGSLGRQHSISQGVYPGKKMAGHYGCEKLTVKNLIIARLHKQRNLLFVKGAVPGPNGGYLVIREAAKQKLPKPVEVKPAKPVKGKRR